jgi:hypothetical protein
MGNKSGIPLLGIVQWARAQVGDLFAHLASFFGEGSSHRRGYVDHLDSVRLQANRAKKVFYSLNAPAGIDIPFLEVAIAFQASRHQNAIGTLLKVVQDL